MMQYGKYYVHAEVKVASTKHSNDDSRQCSRKRKAYSRKISEYYFVHIHRLKIQDVRKLDALDWTSGPVAEIGSS
jgi:hypothetical protein